MDTRHELTTKDTQAALATTDFALVEDWLAFCRSNDNASASTINAYRKSLEVFAGWARQHHQGGAMTPVDILAYKDWLMSKYSAQTVNLRLSAVRSFYRWMVATDKIPVSPAASVKGAKRPKSRRHKRDTLTNGEVRDVLDTCQDDLVGIRDRAMLTLMSYCAVRAVEVHRANIGNLKTEGDRLVLEVQGKGHDEADEVVVIPRDQEHAIRQWLQHRMTFKNHAADDALFVSLSNRTRGKRLTLRAIRDIVKSRFSTAGVVGAAKTTHSLRHTAITNAIRHGASPLQVRQMARHGSFDTTLAYIHEVDRTDNPAEDYITY